MTKYEFTVVYTINEPEKTDSIKAVENLLKSKNVEIVNRKEWGMKVLSYEIAKQNRGFYVYYELMMDGKDIDSIERELSLNPSVLRHLFVRPVYRKVKRRPFAETSIQANVEESSSENNTEVKEEEQE